MPTKANTQPDTFEYQREMAGRYEVYLVEPRVRLGHLLGKPGSWCAETPKGFRISCFNTRSDGAKALLSQARNEKRI